MAQERRNKFRTPEDASNTPSEPIQPESEPATPKSKAKPKNAEQSNPDADTPKAGFLKRLTLFLKNEKNQRLIGLCMLFGTFYSLAAIASYLVYWRNDQDVVNLPLSEFLDGTVSVENKLGKIGALWAHILIYKTFGFASLFILLGWSQLGYGLFLQSTLKPLQHYFKLMGFTIWWALSLSFICYEHIDFLNGAFGGAFGYVWSNQLMLYTGSIGFPALLLLIALLYLFVANIIRFPKPRPKAPLNTQAPLQTPTKDNADEHLDAADSSSAVNTENQHEHINASETDIIASNPELLEFTLTRKSDTDIVETPTDTNAIITVSAQDLPVDLPIEHEPKKNSADPEFIIQTPVKQNDVLVEENKAAVLVSKYGEYDPTLDLGSYAFPEFDLLNDYGAITSKVNQDELVANKNKISTTLKNYGIDIDKISATVGPTVTLYEIVPAAGVRISKIKNLEDDIALSLAALGIRIIAPIPGKGTIGIEVPNQNPEMVPMKNILASEKFNSTTFELPIALGKTISNEVFITDLAKMPHLLMAGATGQGKSVGLNAVLVSLLYKKHPAQVKFVLVDPKKVELTLFNKIERHFLAKLPNSEEAIIIDTTKVIHTLNSLCIEMDNRYALLQDAQVRDIKSYNLKFVQRKLNPNDGHKFLPYIVVVIDEFADLIMTAGKEVETPIARLAQLARAIGIHLIIATQRPSVNIITGTIKANFPARIAFRVTSKIDSRTILDAGGAEQLIGRGDMLLSTGNDIIRIQCAFVDTPEVEKITEFIGSQRAYPSAFMLPEYVGEDGTGGIDEIDLSERDKMFEEAAKLVVQFQQGSASFLQRKLKLGYNRAGRIVDQLEAAGIIGPFEGSKARDVLIKDMVQLDDIFQKLKQI